MANRRQFLRLALAAAAGIPALAARGGRPAAARGVIRAAVGTAQPCPALLLDGALAGQPSYWRDNPALLHRAAGLGASGLTYPGRGYGNYWDWSTGWIDPAIQAIDAGLPPEILALAAHPVSYPLAELGCYQSASRAPLFLTANLLTRNLRATRPPSAEPLRGADPLRDADPAKTWLLDWLTTWEAAGVQTGWVELGDGLAEACAVDHSLARRVFPPSADGATDYPTVALDWANALTRARPGLRVAASAQSAPADAPPALARWNEQLVEALAGPAAALSRALSFSLAIPGGMGVRAGSQPGWGAAAEQKAQYARLKDPQALRELFDLPGSMLRAWLDQPAGGGRSMRGCGLRFWVRAIHLVDPIGALRFTWAHGLLIAAALHAALREPVVELAVAQTVTGLYDAAFFQKEAAQTFCNLLLDETDGVSLSVLRSSLRPHEPTAPGYVVETFCHAMRGAATARPVDLSPLQDGRVWGWQFQGGAGGASLLFGNLTGGAVSVDLSGLITSAQVEAVAQTAAPHAWITRASSQPGAACALYHARLPLSPQGVVELPPYSLTRVASAYRLYLPFARR